MTKNRNKDLSYTTKNKNSDSPNAIKNDCEKKKPK